MPHHGPHGFNVLIFQHGLQLLELVHKQIHLLQKGGFVGYKQLAPHQIVDPGNPGKIPEGVAGEFLHIFLVIAGHQGDGDTMGQLGKDPLSA